MKPRWSILIPSLLCRRPMLNRLLDDLERQTAGLPVELVTLIDSGGMTIGEKRNRLVQAAKGEYLCGIDDDDTVSPNYVASIYPVLGRTDLVTFDVNWQAGEPFMDWFTPSTIGLRPLAVVRSEIAKRFRFPEWWQSEDRAYSTWLAGKRPTVGHLNAVLYNYHFRARKPEYNGGMYHPAGRMASADEVRQHVQAQR